MLAWDDRFVGRQVFTPEPLAGSTCCPPKSNHRVSSGASPDAMACFMSGSYLASAPTNPTCHAGSVPATGRDRPLRDRDYGRDSAHAAREAKTPMMNPSASRPPGPTIVACPSCRSWRRGRSQSGASSEAMALGRRTRLPPGPRRSHQPRRGRRRDAGRPEGAWQCRCRRDLKSAARLGSADGRGRFRNSRLIIRSGLSDAVQELLKLGVSG